jgi:hypothetical protein
MRRAHPDVSLTLVARRLGRCARRIRRAWLCGPVLLAACVPTPAPPRQLTLLQFRQDGKAGVYLDEPLVFHFSDDLDVASITSRSVRATLCLVQFPSRSSFLLPVRAPAAFLTLPLTLSMISPIGFLAW